MDKSFLLYRKAIYSYRLFIKETIGPTLPVLNTEVSSFQRYFCIGLYQLGHYKMSSL